MLAFCLFSKMMVGEDGKRGNVLYKPIATTAAIVVLLKLNKFKFAKGLEDILEILFCNTEVNVADVKTVEGDRVGVRA